jgi:hypothetical protein
MTKKNIFLIALVLLLAGLSLYLNRDWFRAQPIQIGDRSVPPRGGMIRRDQKATANPVIFFLNRPLKLTAVKVIAVADIQTNKYPEALWELKTDSNSVPVKDFVYGANIRGMNPAIKGATPALLEPGIPYRLLIEAGSVKAQHDFTPVPRTP